MCIDYVNSYSCMCVIGFIGKICEIGLIILSFILYYIYFSFEVGFLVLL